MGQSGMPEDGSRGLARSGVAGHGAAGGIAGDIAAGGYLGVTESLTGRVWQGPSVEADRLAAHLVQAAGLPDPLARVLARLGVRAEEAEAYLAPTLRDSLPDPASLRDAGAAAERLNAAVARGARIAIFADY